ncbi:MAG: DUF2497 domain-containing protein [Pseudomonadota bacterium]
MDDLLASIRKIINDDFGERSVTPQDPPARQENSPRMEPHLSSQEGNDDGPLADIDEVVARSIADAFEAADTVLGEEPDPGPMASPRVHTDEDLADQARTMETIATAIAAGSAEERGREATAPSGWASEVLSEPGLDEPAPPVAHTPAEASDERATEDKARPARKDSRSAFGRIAALKASLEAQTTRKIMEREAAAAMEPAMAAEDSEPGDAPRPMPSNVFRLDPDQRTPEMSDIASDHSHDTDGPGNVFRRAAPPPPRQDTPDDGLTSTRTRHNVNQSFDQLSRTTLNNNPRTLEDLVRDMVRPLLREWLEANLGEIVERQVRQEIDRVSARGR